MNRKRKLMKSLLKLVFLIVVVVFFNHMKAENESIERHDASVSILKTKKVLKNNIRVLIGRNLNPMPKLLVNEVNCQGIIEGDEWHISYASKIQNRVGFKFLTDREMGKLAKNCDVFLKTFEYNRFTVSQEELDFPIAYSLIVYKDAVQIEMLLRAIYRPHNAYCIHVDKSSNPNILDAMKAIANCLPNVFIASKLEDVIYEGYSRLQADINCMTDLLHYADVKWKYVINLPAQEYPLKTNAEIVKILKILNGTCSIESIYDEVLHKRTNEIYFVNPWSLKVQGTGLHKRPPPYSVVVGKGSAYGAFSRKFVDFAVNDMKAREILKWTEDTFSPDETFWATLAMNKHLGTPGIKYTASGMPDQRVWISTSITWDFSKPKPKCHGRYVRNVCVFGLGDLHRLVSEKKLFANKFHYAYQPFTLMCMEEWIFNKSVTYSYTDLDYYRDLMND
ncbi:beta-1,3-galactosyl-O-glycosyl-glycoprotein beta-1,6-N-acetylglucosaminyltransferase 4-like isoform X2 [Crassostrea virginica]